MKKGNRRIWSTKTKEGNRIRGMIVNNRDDNATDNQENNKYVLPFVNLETFYNSLCYGNHDFYHWHILELGWGWRVRGPLDKP